MKVKTPKENVTVIPPKPREEIMDRKKGKLRVAAYCRVSSEKDEQIHSYEVQTQYYAERIAKNPEWTLVKVYADRGISGTSLKHRDEFNKMIRACREGRIDLILVKSVSRFGRNIVDTLRVVRSLQQRGVGIIFEEQSIDTRAMNSELNLAFFSAFSQSESESLRENVKAGTLMARKLGFFSVTNAYGFLQDEDGTVTINEEEASVIRQIASWYMNGNSINDVCKLLQQEGIRSPKGKALWSTSTVKAMLTDVKYKGDYVYGKTYSPTLFAERAVKNQGEEPMVVMHDCLPAVFTPEEFQRIQVEMARRSAKRAMSEHSKTPFGRYSGKYALSNLLICNHCGAYYRRVTLRLNGNTKIVWKCGTHQDQASNCPDSPRIFESTLQDILMSVIRNEYLEPEAGKKNVLSALEGVITPAGRKPEEAALRIRLEDLNRRKRELMSKCLESDDDEQYDSAFRRIVDDISATKEQLKLADELHQEQQEFDERISEIRAELAQMEQDSMTYDDLLIRKAVECIRVLSNRKISIVFKDGRTVQADLPELTTRRRHSTHRTRSRETVMGEF